MSKFENKLYMTQSSSLILIYSLDAGDVPSLVGQAMSIYKTIAREQESGSTESTSTLNDKIQTEKN